MLPCPVRYDNIRLDFISCDISKLTGHMYVWNSPPLDSTKYHEIILDHNHQGGTSNCEL